MNSVQTYAAADAESSEELRCLGRFHELLSGIVRVDDLLDETARVIAEEIGDFCVVHMRDRGNGANTLHARACHDRDSHRKGTLIRVLAQTPQSRIGSGVLGTVVATGEPFIADDWAPASLSSAGCTHARVCEAMGARGVAVLPLRGADHAVLGALSMGLCSQRAYSRTHLHTAQLLAAHAGLKLQSAQLLEQIQSRNDELRQANVRLRYFRALIDDTDDAVLSKQLDGTVTSWNAAAERLYGYGADEMLGRNIVRIVPHDRLDEHRSMMEALPRGERVHLETVRRNKAGAEIEVSLTISPIRDLESGKIIGASTIGRDITAQKQAAAERDRLVHQLEEAVSAREAFISVASHELRTPLSSLRLSVQALLRRGARDPSTLQPKSIADKLAGIDRQVNRLAQLVEKLLDVSHVLENGRVSLDLTRFDLRTLVAEVVERFGDEAARAGCEMTLETLDDPVMGTWDQHRVDQVVTNLLANAIKYGAGRPVALRVYQRDGVPAIDVQDRGSGIAPRNRQRIFQRFERLASTRRHGGLGLGLWIANQIVDALGGTIDVRSAPQGGSTFTVVLPTVSEFAAEESRPAMP